MLFHEDKAFMKQGLFTVEALCTSWEEVSVIFSKIVLLDKKSYDCDAYPRLCDLIRMIDPSRDNLKRADYLTVFFYKFWQQLLPPDERHTDLEVWEYIGDIFPDISDMEGICDVYMENISCPFENVRMFDNLESLVVLELNNVTSLEGFFIPPQVRVFSLSCEEDMEVAQKIKYSTGHPDLLILSINANDFREPGTEVCYEDLMEQYPSLLACSFGFSEIIREIDGTFYAFHRFVNPDVFNKLTSSQVTREIWGFEGAMDNWQFCEVLPG